MINGIINIYKEKGFTSHDVVAKLRGITKQKKIGHTGTLDPDATGVLPVCFGNATKLCDLLTDKDKVYETVLLLGRETDTQDITGQIVCEKEVSVTEDNVKRAITSFVGEIEQIPPMYSALKVNGKKLYELAREGKVIERKARPITIHSIDILNINLSGETKEITMRVSCSKGTYIRTLCHDIGNTLGCGGCMKSLVRTVVSRFKIEDALTLSEVEELKKQDLLQTKIVKVDDMFTEYPKVYVNEVGNRFLSNGNPLKSEHIKEIKEEQKNTEMSKNVRIYDVEGNFTAIYEWVSKNQLRPVKMFPNA